MAPKTIPNPKPVIEKPWATKAPNAKEDRPGTKTPEPALQKTTKSTAS